MFPSADQEPDAAEDPLPELDELLVGAGLDVLGFDELDPAVLGFDVLGFDVPAFDVPAFVALDVEDEDLAGEEVVEPEPLVALPMSPLTPSSTVSLRSPTRVLAKSFTVSTPCCTAGWFQTFSAARRICS
ncbi:hypothetical protein [Agromyces bauzanensis]